MKTCYAILCKNKKTGGFYPRYITTISDNPITLEDVRVNAYPQAVKLFTAPTRQKATLILAPYIFQKDPPQQGLFDSDENSGGLS